MTDMQPEIPQPQFQPERAPVERAPKPEQLISQPTPEQGIERSSERREQAAESRSVISDLPTAAPVPQPVAIPTIPQDDTAAPLVADDADLIEKEWVDRAKKIIQDTRDNPARREEQVSQLQKDYLKKRYGKVIGAAE